MLLWIDARMVSSSGIGTVLKNLILPLSSAPFETRLILHPASLEKEKWVGNLPAKLCDASIYSIKEQLAIPRLVSKADLFWSPHYNIPLLPLRAKKRIVTIHDAYHLAFKQQLSWKKRTYAEMMFRQATSRSDLIITDSKFSQEELSRLLALPKGRIEVIYPGVDISRFSKRAAKETIQKKYALPKEFFLFVGNVKAHKNLQLILEAYEKNQIDVPLVIVGKTAGLLEVDPALTDIENRHHLREKIFVLGEVLDEELPAFYQMALSLIFPSLYEGFGLPPLEAMAAGCPAIVSNRASLPEVCGRAAFFVDGERADELGDAMLQMIRDEALRNAYREKGKIHVEKFSWEKCAAQYRKVFEEIHFS